MAFGDGIKAQMVTEAKEMERTQKPEKEHLGQQKQQWISAAVVIAGCIVFISLMAVLLDIYKTIIIG